MKLLKNNAPRPLALVALLAFAVATPLAAQQSIPLDIVPLTPVEVEPVIEELVAPSETAEPLEAAPREDAAGDARVEVGAIQALSAQLKAVVKQNAALVKQVQDQAKEILAIKEQQA